MSEATHTPGPWRVDTTVALGAYGVWTDYATHPGHDGTGYGSMICSFTGEKEWYKGDKAERNANAALIAAAPDMLAALEAAAVLLGEIDPVIFDGRDEVPGLVRAAIAKAKAIN